MLDSNHNNLAKVFLSSSSTSAASSTSLCPALVAGKDARWIALSADPTAKRIDLMRYGARRRILNRLVVTRLEQPNAATPAEALIEAGWPGERMQHTAGLLRVYSAIRRLRRLGLESILLTRDDGYLIDPDADVQCEP
jgi:hypothetical protein